MDLGDITQVALVATTIAVFGRIGWALARLIDRRSVAGSGLSTEAAERIRALEDEQAAVRQQLAELQERQDFTERVMVRERAEIRPPATGALAEPAITPR
jgi:hypothetical protein